MSETSDRNDSNEYSYPTQPSTPRWIPLVVLLLAVVAFVGMGLAYRTNASLQAAESSRQALAADVAALRNSIETLSERLKNSEDSSADLQGELSVVTEKLKLTEGELGRARRQSKQIREDYAKRLSEVESTVKSELATKATSDELKALGGDISGVRSDLEATKQNLQMARGELGTLIARNHEEIEQLRRLGQRDYFEFQLARKGTRERLGSVIVELRGVNTKRNQFTVALYVDDMRLEKKNRSVNEPIYFYTAGSRSALELVVNKVEKDKITGYLSVPKGPVTVAGK